MEDLGGALNHYPEMIFMGGGNPAQIIEVEQALSRHLQNLAQDEQQLHKLLGEYQPPQGDPVFLGILADYLSKKIGASLTSDNIAISNGGQSAFFTLFNIVAGQNDDGLKKKILLPMVPDYLGYADAGLDADMFIAVKPKITLQAKHFFKYQIDFDKLPADESIAAVCLSRPANPSGNIVTDEEVQRLQRYCQQHSIPLILDLAYGKPFPNVTFVNHSLYWDENTILVMSLSKLGLPGARTGIVVANKETIRGFSRATASMSLAPSNLGPALCKSLLSSGELDNLVETHVRPFYQQKMQQTCDYLLHALSAFPIKLHQPEGAFFLWLWLQDLPITSQDLYLVLKEKGVLVLSGHHFFEPLKASEWPHQHQCLRLSYCQPWEKVKEGIDRLAAVLEEYY